MDTLGILIGIAIAAIIAWVSIYVIGKLVPKHWGKDKVKEEPKWIAKVDSINERLWKLENTPEFKVGDKVWYKHWEDNKTYKATVGIVRVEGVNRYHYKYYLNVSKLPIKRGAMHYDDMLYSTESDTIRLRGKKMG